MELQPPEVRCIMAVCKETATEFLNGVKEKSGMAHIEKYNRAAVGHLIAHYDRQAENIGNESVDRTRSHLNYNLAAELQPMKQGDFLRQRCSEVKVQKRKDVNVMCTWVVTAPKDLPENEQDAFFKAAFDFMADRYGRENVISAYVHLDETTPHIHFAFVPVVVDKKKGGFKVSAKERIDRKELRSFHQELEQAVSAVLGHPVGILNDATKQGNMTVAELKQATALVAIQEAEEMKSRADRKKERAKQEEKIAEISIVVAHDRVHQTMIETGEAIKESIETKTVVEAQTKQYQQQASDLEAQNKALQEQLALLQKQVQSLEEERDKLMPRIQEMTELAQQYQSLSEQVNSLKKAQKTAESRLSELQGQVLTAEEAEKISCKKVPMLGTVYDITYKEILDLKATATAVRDVRARGAYLDSREKSLNERERTIDQKEDEVDHRLALLFRQADEVERNLIALVRTEQIARRIKKEADSEGLESKEEIQENISKIRQSVEETKQQQTQSRPQKRHR